MSGDWTRQLRDLVTEFGGGEIQLTKGCHYAIKLVRAKIIVFASSTPSDHRAIKNLRAQLRRAARSQ